MNNCPTCKGIKMSLSFIDADLRKAVHRGNRGDDVSGVIAAIKNRKARQKSDLAVHLIGH